jgi:sec-independent protein translocase protein TatA
METFSLFGFLGGFGPMEMMIVGIVALLLFGNRLPDTMRSLGRGFREFRDGIKGIESDIDREVSP